MLPMSPQRTGNQTLQANISFLGSLEARYPYHQCCDVSHVSRQPVAGWCSPMAQEETDGKHSWKLNCQGLSTRRGLTH
ncbi:rCG20661, isoform CRA_b [Rattus norvegicus]|uniref:RCG20661, isoform CRA_b n=1 Tax=Rattus norvegicus TaxID=10116 RepID=A6JEP6_RAT|nr:rCG20661, isoform CRA_b [Rattus norvegicus]